MKCETIKKVICKSPCHALKPVLHRWTELVNRYSELDPEDACYWYNERATLSVLAAAAWQIDGWVGLEEYPTRKVSQADPADPEPKYDRHGRCDLYVAKRRAGAQYACEAKLAWQPMGNPSIQDDLRVVRVKRRAAFNAAAELNKLEAAHRMAVTLCVPTMAMFRSQPTANEVTAAIEQWCKTFRGAFKFCALAYCFPGVSRMLTNEYGRRYFPGVAILFQEHHKGHAPTRDA